MIDNHFLFQSSRILKKIVSRGAAEQIREKTVGRSGCIDSFVRRNLLLIQKVLGTLITYFDLTLHKKPLLELFSGPQVKHKRNLKEKKQ